MADILDEMTKEEMIYFIRRTALWVVRGFKKSELLFYRWQKKSDAQTAKWNAHIKEGKNLNLKKRDEFAKKFNATSDAKERIRLIKKMAPFDKRFKAWVSDGKKLRDADDKIEQLFKQIDIERQKEMETTIP